MAETRLAWFGQCHGLRMRPLRGDCVDDSISLVDERRFEPAGPLLVISADALLRAFRRMGEDGKSRVAGNGDDTGELIL